MPRMPRSVDLTSVTEWSEGKLRRVEDYLAGEEPLEIRVGRAPLVVTMRTPGHDRELAAGFLLTEGVIQRREQIRALENGSRRAAARDANVVCVRLAAGARFNRKAMKRNSLATASCGICGKAAIDSVRRRRLAPPNRAFRIPAALLCELPERLVGTQAIFDRTGGLHAAALFDTRGELIASREDVGRHNAVDKVIGWALLEGRLPLAENVLLVSGRGGFEIVQKAIVAGVPVVACVSAPSSLAVQLARELGLTLVGFLRGKRFVVYSGEERLLTG
jgi:FdhD protein